MTLNAGVGCLHIIEFGWIDDVRLTLVLHVIAARTMAALAPDVPLRDLLRVDVVVDGMAAVAERPGRPLHVVGWIERRPPVTAVLDEIWAPELMNHIPLGRKHKVVIAHLFEIALLPFTPVDEGNV